MRRIVYAAFAAAGLWLHPHAAGAAGGEPAAGADCPPAVTAMKAAVKQTFGSFKRDQGSSPFATCGILLYPKLPDDEAAAALIRARLGRVDAAGSPAIVHADFSDEGIRLSFTFAQRSPLQATVTFAGVSLVRDDTVTLYLSLPAAHRTKLLAAVNPLGKCSTRSFTPLLRLVHDECSAKIDFSDATDPVTAKLPKNCASGAHCWKGSLTVPYKDLAANGLLAAMDIRVGRTVHVDDQPVSFFSSTRAVSDTDTSEPNFGDASEWMSATVTTSVDVASGQYVQFGPNIGNTPGNPPHRATAGIILPTSPSTMLSATFSDASGSLLTQRDKTLKSVLPADQAKQLKCVACGSFQTDQNTTVWQPPVTTARVLGIDFGKLGVDTEPFSFGAVGYPVDAGYKLIAGSGAVGLAAMNGTTSKNGVAHDRVLAASTQIGGLGNQLVIGVYDVDARRSALPAGKPPAFAAIPVPSLHTANTELSFGYSRSTAVSAIDDPSFSTGEVTALGMLLRYGTQHTGGAQRVDVAVATGFQPGFSEFARPQKNRPRWSAALGFRAIGLAYAPIDADFDPATGLHGFYGAVQYAQPAGARDPLTLGFVFHHFADALEARDTAAAVSASIRLGHGPRPFSLDASMSTGSLAMSQVGKLVGKIVIPDSMGGARYLPNSSYSGGVTYSGKDLIAKLGYSQGYQQNCNVKLPAPPCFAYRQPSLTGAIFWQPAAQIFVAGSIENQNNEALELPGTASAGRLGAAQQTTAGHIVRKGVIGLKLPALTCSTIAFTTENRGGDIDSFAASPPQPGFTNTISLDIAPKGIVPAILVAYSRSGTLQGTAPPTRQVFVRLLSGLPGNRFAQQVRAGCARA